MKNEEFKKLFYEYDKTKSDEAKEKISKELIKIMRYIVLNDYKSYSYDTREELLSLGYLLISKTLNDFDYKKGAIGPYFIKSLHWELKKYLYRTQAKWDKLYSLEDDAGRYFQNIIDNDVKLMDRIEDKTDGSNVEDFVIEKIMYEYECEKIKEGFKYLTPVERKVIILRYGFNTDNTGKGLMSYYEIAEILGYKSHCFMQRLDKRAISKIKKVFNNEPFTEEEQKIYKLNKYIDMPFEEKKEFAESSGINKEVVELFFGLYDDPIWDPTVIASDLNLTTSCVKSRLGKIRKRIYEEK